MSNFNAQAKAKSDKPYANHPERQVLNYLRSGAWMVLNKLPVPAGERLVKAMEAKGWIELRGRGTEVRITATGDAAVRAAVPVSGSRQSEHASA